MSAGGNCENKKKKNPAGERDGSFHFFFTTSGSAALANPGVEFAFLDDSAILVGAAVRASETFHQEAPGKRLKIRNPEWLRAMFSSKWHD